MKKASLVNSNDALNYFLDAFFSAATPASPINAAATLTVSIIMKTAFQPFACETAPRVYEVTVLPM